MKENLHGYHGYAFEDLDEVKSSVKLYGRKQALEYFQTGFGA